jgi:hypothetical protein
VISFVCASERGSRVLFFLQLNNNFFAPMPSFTRFLEVVGDAVWPCDERKSRRIDVTPHNPDEQQRGRAYVEIIDVNTNVNDVVS